MVGIATFDSTIHFYNLKRALQQVRIIGHYFCTSQYINMMKTSQSQHVIHNNMLAYQLIFLLLLQPLMLIVPDIQDVYTPLQTDVIVPLSEVSNC